MRTGRIMKLKHLITTMQMCIAGILLELVFVPFSQRTGQTTADICTSAESPK